MRIRIRGPSGQSTVTLDDGATVDTLRKTITAETSLPSFDIKFGYPPQPLRLDRYSTTKLLTELDIKLNGEQLIVSKSESTSNNIDADIVTSSAQARKDNVSSAGPSGDAPEASRPPITSSPERPKSDKRPSGAPLSLSRKENPDMSEPPEVFVPEVGGTLVLRIMPDDNSCLFRAVASAVMSDLDAVTELRSVIAQSIQLDRDKYTKVILDNKEPDTYAAWIQTEDAWGGQIELDILSQNFDVEICSIDVQSLRVDRYNEGAMQRCFVVYSGIHYDTIALSMAGLGPEEDVKLFEQPISDEILPHAVALCKKLQDKHYYTDTAAFKLRCGDCGVVCTGESGATEHAAKTGHYNFGEYS